MDGPHQNVEMKRNFKKCQPANIEFIDLKYKVMENLKKTKDILDGISGEFRSGELTAIIGPSGSGKSTLLNLLAGYRIQQTSGEITINGQPMKREQFRKMSRYVLQTDLICPHFSIKETLMFASNFKYQPDYNNAQRLEEVTAILNQFHLNEQGNTLISKISGGELKRISIALEMMDNPSVLFLDEPTTGLDEYSAMQCIIQLKHLAQCGRTIICSVHSPSARILDMIDKVYVLAQGQCIYQGKGNHIVPYLQSLELNCPLTYNPADFIIEVATHEYGNYHYELVRNIQNGKISKWLPHSDSSEAADTNGVIKTLDDDLCFISHSDKVQRRNWWTEYKCLFLQNIKQMLRDKANLKLRTLLHLFLSATFGFLYFDIGKSAKFAAYHFHMCLLCAVMCAFVSMTPMFAYVAQEMEYLRRQHFNQWYRLGTWYMALLTAQLPLVCIMSFLSAAILFLLSGQPMELFRFAMYSIIMLLTTLVGISYGVFMGSRLRLLNALFMGTNVLGVWIVLSCLSINMTEMPIMSTILMYSSFLRHSIEGLMSALFQYHRTDFICDEIFCFYSKPRRVLQTAGLVNIDFMKAALYLLGFHGFFVALAYLNFKSRLNPHGILGANAYYLFVKRVMANFFNFGEQR